ncbi:MAG TPA: cupredoxin domain-containing protein [Rhizomicrobium sp.]|jgi:plastocyanin
MRVTAGIFALALLAPQPLSHPALAADAMVVMKNFDFSPMDVTVTAGSTVTWKNLDGEPHTVISADGAFRSPALDENDTYQFKFDRPGVYKYLCSIHPKMMATITVK